MICPLNSIGRTKIDLGDHLSSTSLQEPRLAEGRPGQDRLRGRLPLLALLLLTLLSTASPRRAAPFLAHSKHHLISTICGRSLLAACPNMPSLLLFTTAIPSEGHSARERTPRLTCVTASWGHAPGRWQVRWGWNFLDSRKSALPHPIARSCCSSARI